jgi:hypothetical protein
LECGRRKVGETGRRGGEEAEKRVEAQGSKEKNSPLRALKGQRLKVKAREAQR